MMTAVLLLLFDRAEEQPEQVIENHETNLTTLANICRSNPVKLSHIKPEPTQLLEVFSDVAIGQYKCCPHRN